MPRIVLFAAALLLLGAACSGDSPPAAGTASPGQAAAPESAAASQQNAPSSDALASETVSDPSSAGGLLTRPDPAEVRRLPLADAPYWPRFHGPKANNISPETGLLKRWPEEGPPLVWTAEGIGEGFSGVTLAGGLIYTAGNKDEKSVVTALDLDGNIVWQAAVGPAWTGGYPGTRATPTIDGDRVYYETPVGDVACLHAWTGEPIWSLNILERFDGENIRWALAESVLIDGDRAICCPGGKKGSVVALDKRTGRTVWATPSTGHSAAYASPRLAEMEGLRMILTMNAKSLLGVEADTGRLLFEHGHETEYDVNALMPVYRDGQVFVSSGYGAGSELVALSVEGKNVRAEQVWEEKTLDNHHGGVVVLDGFIYGSAYKGKWICLDWNTGEQRYSAKGVGKGALTCAEGMLYTLSERGKVGLVPATPEEHQVVSQFQLPPGGDGPSWAHPVICAGRLYLRHGDYLYAYDVRQQP